MSLDEEKIKKEWVVRVKELMPQKGFKTYQDLAYASGVSAGSLNQAMRGMHLPRQTTIDWIATALGTTSQFLLYGDNMKVRLTVPFLRHPEAIFDWVYGEKDRLGMNPNFVEADDSLGLSENSFAWMVDQNDMEPMFCAGDLVIIDPLKIQDIKTFIYKSPVYIMILKLEKGSNKPVGTLFGRVFLTISGYFVAPVNEKIPYVRVEDNWVMVGAAVQSIRTFRFD